MARDEALMTLVGEGDSPSTLRLYQWDPPTISLGYFQHFADYLALPPPAGELPVVRRLTGGGAILHDLELTYSITLPTDHPLLTRGPGRLYELAHDAVIAALAELGMQTGRCGVSDDSGAAKGPFFCFQRRHCYDVLLGDEKIAGSAQRRSKSAVLQHGSIVLGNRYPQQPTAAAAQPFDEAVRRVRCGIAEAFARLTDMPLEPGAWTERELTLAAALGDKYAGDAWTRRT
jgi:lipoate-protein ligase A